MKKNNHPFTEKELSVLHLIAQGLNNQEIADQLEISINTIKTHRRNILKRTKMRNFIQIAVHYTKKGVI